MTDGKGINQFPYSLPKTGNPINNQEHLIQELTIALGLIHSETRESRETGAQIMIELMNSPIQAPAHRESAFSQAKKNIQ